MRIWMAENPYKNPRLMYDTLKAQGYDVGKYPQFKARWGKAKDDQRKDLRKLMFD
jgi:hypothetical protein